MAHAAAKISKSVIRAGLDIGSGSAKCVIARISQKTQQIEEELYASYTPVLLAHDYKSRTDGCLGETVIEKLLEVLRSFREAAAKVTADGEPCEMVGVATQIFRLAKNGPALLERIQTELNINVKVISQELEGELGFLTGSALCPDTPPQNVVVWDSGGASYQLTTKDQEGNLLICQGPLGSSIVTADMVNVAQKGVFQQKPSPNPVSPEHAERLADHIKPIVGDVPSWLKDRLEDPNTCVVGIGEKTSMFHIAELATGNAKFSALDVGGGMEKLFGQTDDDLARFPQPTMVIPKLVLLKTVMDVFQIPFTYCKLSVGICPGVLVYPPFWQSNAEDSDKKLMNDG